MIKWFIQNYPDYVTQMRACSYHSNNNINLHHLEGDVWSHTMLSYSKGLNFGVSKTVLIALFLHDIGRIFTRYIDSKGSVSFGDFEGVSCFVSLDILNKLDLSENEKVDILKIIMNQYNVIDFVKYDETSFDKFVKKYEYNEELVKYLFSYVKCDLFGRIIDSSKSKYYDLSKIQFYEKEASSLKLTHKKKVDKDKKNLYILIGLPCSGKSRWIEENHKDAFLISRDYCIDTIGKKYAKKSHDEAYELQDKNENISKEVDELYESRLKNSYATSEDVIVDNLNLRFEVRQKIITRYKDTHNIYGVLFLKSYNYILNCDKKRTKSENKTIGKTLLIKNMMKFRFPMLKEGFDDIEYIFE